MGVFEAFRRWRERGALELHRNEAFDQIIREELVNLVYNRAMTRAEFDNVSPDTKAAFRSHVVKYFRDLESQYARS